MSDNILSVDFESGKVTNEQFLKTIFGADLKNAYVTGFKTDPSKEVTQQRRSQMWLGNCYESFNKKLLDRDYNTFFCISTFHKAKDDRRYRRRTSLVNKTYVIMIDDVGPKVKDKDLKLPPSYRLETSPGNFQCGYILTHGEDDTLAVNELIEHLINGGLNVEVDPGMAGTNRYGRLPVGMNNKEKYGEPFKHRLREWLPERRYTIDEIASAYGIALQRNSLHLKKQEAVEQGEDEILKALRKEGLIKEENPAKPGCYDMTCLWVDEHTGGRDNGTAYFTPGFLDAALGEVYTDGGYTCHHGHCVHRHLADVIYELNQRGHPVRHPQLIRAFSDAYPEDEDWTTQLEISARANKVKPTALNAEIILANDPLTKGAIRYDVLSQTIICMPALPWHKGEPQIRNMDKPDLRSHIAREYGVEFSLQTLTEAIQALANRSRYDALREYLKALVWDGRERLSGWLVDYAGAEDSPYVRGVARLALLGAAARALEPGCKFDYMLILEGEQGVGKTQFLSTLVPKEQWYTDLDVDISRRLKEAVSEIQGKWIIEMGELSSMTRSETAAFKRFVSRTTDHIRLAYRADAEGYKRRCIFIGTTNEAEYLEDMTGGRRFWPVPCSDRFDLEGLEANRDQIWAEAVRGYYDGEALYPDKELEKLCVKEQEDRRCEHPWEQPIADYVDERYDITVSEICLGALDMMDEKTLKQFERNLIGKILRRLGFGKSTKIRRSGKLIRGYRRR